jgi:polysaccharide biosynthesis/export protein
MKGQRRQGDRFLLLGLLCGLGVGSLGCGSQMSGQPELNLPRELRMTTLPPYVIEPPDILIITTVRVIPKAPYHLQPLDALFVDVTGTPEGRPIHGIYSIDPDGTINLGLGYGAARVSGLTLDDAKVAVAKHLANVLTKPQVEVALAQSRGQQQIQGDHLVRMDGTIGLGVYGSVFVTGMTIDQARKAIEDHLSNFIQDPEISLDVYAYNSKWYYVIQDRAGFGQTMYRLPITGRDTVLDALSMVFGTYFMSSNRHVWLARPNGKDPNQMQVLPINMPALIQGGSPATNYQLMPGDRLYIQSNPLLAFNNRLNQVLMPIERMLGFTLLGTATVQSFQQIGILSRTTASGASGVVTPGGTIVGTGR